jgi:hypothetical protein
MMKHRLARAAVVVLLAAIGFFYPLLAPTPHRVDREHFRLIRPGMTEGEVEAIFGVPAGGYDWAVQDENSRIEMLLPFMDGWESKIPGDQLAFSGRTMFISARHGPKAHFKTWISRHGVFYVALNQQGRVAATGIWVGARSEPPWLRWWRQLVGK